MTSSAGLLGATVPDLDKLQQHPYVVSVHRQGDDQFLCSGALVSDKVVLTAAACLDKSTHVMIRTLGGQLASSEKWETLNLPPEQQVKLAAVTLQQRVPGPHLEVGSATCGEDPHNLTQGPLTFVSFGGGGDGMGSVLTAKASVGSYPCGGAAMLPVKESEEHEFACVTLDAPHACAGGLGGLIISSSGGTQVAVGVATSVTCSSKDPSARWFLSAAFALVQPELEGINRAVVASRGGDAELLLSVVGQQLRQEEESAEGPFRNPQGAAMALGRLIVADTGNDALRSVNLETGDTETLLQFEGFRPRGVAAVGSSVYVTGNHLAAMVDASTGARYLVASSPGSPQGTTDGPLLSARFSYPRGIAVLDSGMIFVADTGSGSVRIINPHDAAMVMGQSPRTVRTLRGPELRLQRPYGLLPFQGDKLLVSDKHRISVLRPDGSGSYVATVLAGSTSPGSNDGGGQWALFSSPSSMVLNGTELLVSDRDNSAVRSIDAATGRVRTIYDGRAASGESAPLKHPEGLVLSADGSALYVVSSGTKRVIKLPAELLRRTAACRKKALAAHTGAGQLAAYSAYWLG